MRNNNVKPSSLQGSAVTDRMKALMGLNESTQAKNTHGFELVKKGSNGKAYAIVREAHEYVIKVADLKEGLSYSEFNYIGGLANKRQFVYESYSKATQAMSLRLMSLHENYGGECNYGGTDLYRNDMELAENPMLALGDDIEYMPSEEDVFADAPTPMQGMMQSNMPEMSANDIAIDNMLSGSFGGPEIDEVEMGFDDEEYSFDGMSDKIFESYNKLNSLLGDDEDEKKKV